MKFKKFFLKTVMILLITVFSSTSYYLFINLHEDKLHTFDATPSLIIILLTLIIAIIILTWWKIDFFNQKLSIVLRVSVALDQSKTLIVHYNKTVVFPFQNRRLAHIPLLLPPNGMTEFQFEPRGIGQYLRFVFQKAF